ncbi:DUF1592 domain-containing protein [Roseibacillus persicicus]|uniref:DUF1592 domain-containing protein n=1 Tax=Roseibacillus persicicus TaxID=454148 RepID=UPI00280CB9AE|nr:DUF1592 domain-containing protein [Roseibacillus persicicus]MDQ8190809.1 DUF1592 domain-containing protein [Roseibacillus persicicus]
MRSFFFPLILTGLLSAEEPGPPVEAVVDLVELYCVDCHGGGIEKGGLDLEALLERPLTGHSDIWEKALLRLDTRQMPPPDEERPDEEEYQAIVAALSGQLDRAAKNSPQVGRGETLRRLTRTEYRNAVRDLLGLEVDVSELLPKDDSSHGFDNVTVSNLSPTLLNRYLTAAQKISRLAVGNAPASPEGRVFRLPPDRTQEKHVPGLPLGTRGGVLLPHTFPVAGTYEVSLRLTRDRDEMVEGLYEDHEVEVLVDGERKSLMTVSRPKGRKDFTQVDANLKCLIEVPAGPAELGVTFVAKPPKLLENKREPYDASYNRHRHPRQSPALYQVSIVGPMERSETQPFGVLAETGLSPEDERAAAEKILRPLVRRAYRREVDDEDLVRPLEFFKEARGEGFQAGMEAALAAVLVSPRFLFRVEDDPEGLPSGTVYPLDNFAIASRLSFFLWSSLPDDQLLDLAAAGQLSQPEVLRREAQRMLTDRRADSLVTNFADQWLHLRNLDSIAPDLRLFPDFDDNLRQSFRRETELLFETVMREDRPVVDLLTADFTFLDERLAVHYGIPGIYGSRFRRVSLEKDSQRGGLLRQGSFLAVSSYANRTSPVIRGNWVLETILGTPTPPPPPDIPALDDSVVSAKLPMRERLAAHSAKPACATCHDLMDPIGFALENYDAVGRWRSFEEAVPVDSLGGLPDGRTFQGVEPLIAGLAERPDLFARALTEKLLTYALGRGLEASDQPAIREILRGAADNDYLFSELVLGIVRSQPFTMSQTR